MRRLTAVVAIALAGPLLTACSSFMHGYTAVQYQNRMLAAGVGAGAKRLELEREHDAVLRGYVEDHGSPDYLYVVDGSEVHLIYLGADTVATFTRQWTSNGTATLQRPIPHKILEAVTDADRRRVLSQRDGAPARERSAEGQNEPTSVDAPTDPVPQLSTGTCFAVSGNGWLVTAAHVVAGANHIAVRLADGRELAATVERTSGSTDLALLRIAAPTPAYLTAAPVGAVQVGDRVFTFGYPAIDMLGIDVKFSEGSVSALSGYGGDSTYMQVSVPTHPGNSGGPLVTENGHLAGVVLATARPAAFLKNTGTLPQNINWGVRGEYVKALLDLNAPANLPTVGRSGAVERARRAVCLVVAKQ